MFASRAQSKLQDDSYILPIELLQNLHSHRLSNKKHFTKFCLFLDIDGTISAFHPDPQQSFIVPSVIENILKLQQLDLPICAVTGRSLNDAIHLFQPVQLTIAATHGLEIKYIDQPDFHEATPPFDFTQIDNEIIKFKKNFPNIRIEQKNHARALHVREHPELDREAATFSQNLCQKFPVLKVHAGKFVYEIILQDADKGRAIEKIYHTLKPETYLPIFIGDDKTDEAGFDAVNALNGFAVKVGHGKTKAPFRLKDVDQVTQFIQLFQEYVQANKNNNPPSPNLREILCLN